MPSRPGSVKSTWQHQGDQVYGHSQDGRSQDGRSQDGRSQDGHSQDGHSQDGHSQDGLSQDGLSQDDFGAESCHLQAPCDLDDFETISEQNHAICKHHAM